MKPKNTLDECGFVISEKDDKVRCTEKKGCEVCQYCRKHCLEHLQLRPHIKYGGNRHASAR